jgi:hypothetical protein
MVESRGVYRALVGRPGEKKPLEDPGVDGRIILRWLLRKWGVMAWTESIWLRTGPGGSTCECGNEPSGTIKCGEFLTSCKPVIFSRKTLFH